MLGKKLFALLVSLNNGDHRALLNLCSRSGDKRHQFLKHLAIKRPDSIDAFQIRLADVRKELVDPRTPSGAGDMIVRRFLDFSTREIENLKMQSLLNSDARLRAFVLSNVFDHAGMRHIQEKYLEETELLAGNEYLLREYAMSRLMSLKLVSQTRQAVNNWREMVLRKKSMLHQYYQQNMAQLYDMASSSYFDDREALELFSDLKTDHEQLDLQARISEGFPEAALLKLSLARFRFLEPKICESCLEEAEILILPHKGKDADLIRRKIAFARFMHDFHYGQSADLCLDRINVVLGWNEKYEIEDHKSWLYYLILKILLRKTDQRTDEIRQKFRKAGSTTESDYMADFTDALFGLVSGDTGNSRRLLSGLSYGPNPYLSIWSRLLEMMVCLKAGDDDLLESLAVRTDRLLHQNRSRIFTMDASISIFCRILDLAGLRRTSLCRKQDIGKVNLPPLHLFMKEELQQIADHK